MLAISLGDFADEGPREALIGFCVGVGVTAVLSKVMHIFHKSAREERQEHHDEAMAEHKAIREAVEK